MKKLLAANALSLILFITLLTACNAGGINSSIPAKAPIGASANEMGQSCRKSEDNGRMYEVIPTTSSSSEFNKNTYAKLKQKHLDGCASVEFQIDNDGTPTHIRLLKESPKGYGVGAGFIEQMKATRFEPPAKNGEWYFKNSVILTSDE